MGKVVFWLVVVFGALFVLRIANAAKLRKRVDASRKAALAGVPMVQCDKCGVFLPRGEALQTAEGFRCTGDACGARR